MFLLDHDWYVSKGVYTHFFTPVVPVRRGIMVGQLGPKKGSQVRMP